MSNVLIADGGLAGSAVAIQLGRLGVSAELFECGRFPKEKPCGEGLMPAGVAALERLGLNGTKGATFNWLAEFDCERESLLRDYRRLTALLLWLARNPAFLSVSLETMCRLPRVFSHLLGVAAGTRRLRGALPARDRVPAPTVQRKIWPVLPERRGDRAA